MQRIMSWLGTTVILVSTTGASAAILHVPAEFPTIQSCIDAAVSGVDQCVVAPGTYHETINLLGKAIIVRSSGGRDVTTIDATGIGGSVVTCSNGEGADTVLNGFAITGGTGTVGPAGSRHGGGMYNFFSSPTVTHCSFRDNTATLGGAMANRHQLGGGATVTHCEFTRNTASEGGAIYNFFGSPELAYCRFYGNGADRGGGLYNFSSGAKLTSCVFSGNTSRLGGGIFNDGTYRTGLTITHTTFAGNRSNAGGAMDHLFPCDPQIVGSILWGNSPDEIRNTNSFSAPSLRFSNAQGGLPDGTIDGGGNSHLDPLFVRPPSPGPDGTWGGLDDDYGDLRLQAASPCIDAGDPAFVGQPGETDLDGHARVLCGRVDTGAFESGIGDYDCNQTVNLDDFAAWSSCMTGPQSGPYKPACEGFDFDGDVGVDLRDFAQFELILVP